MNLPLVHLAIMQPAGYVHSLGFLDQARYFRYQFRRMGAEVTISKNRLREDAVNFVFGAHLGFPAEWTRRHACIFVNLEQLGQGGAQVNADYLNLLRRNAVCDYDADNLAAYLDPAADPADIPLFPFAHAPYLRGDASPALEERPIDLLFFGSMNPRRRAFLDKIEQAGFSVASFDTPVYGPERDDFIRQAKAVLNCHFYESSRFEQARAFQCLSLGTPVISERTPRTRPGAAFEDAVFWLDGADPAAFFREQFNQPAFFDAARAKLDAFTRHDPIEAYADLLAFAAGFHQAHGQTRGSEPWRPARINLGSGKDYKPGWLNIDILERAEPDLVLDLGQPVSLPLAAPTCRGGHVQLEAGQLELVYANNVLEHVPDLPMLMGNVLALLKEGGQFMIEVPYEHAPTAWQDPTHLRALNENSWLYYTDWFWYLGWFDHRFEIAEFKWLDLQLKPCAKEQAAFMKVNLRKIATSLRERTTARTMRADFGGIEADDVWQVPDDGATAGTGSIAGSPAAATN
ncbi:methyltransferase domain-containing protein [Ideonella sp.]|uniref:methyltransferase domain-containing protein n=1 Tax=Ideonella sp. TaxID=1929293 RepID=UPI002B45AD4D|nr:methyltransferase domain-containing protein [Ideonella sp.]HJV70839.1 methyltransferase domain-containing protein [Ideonella sp.]